MPDEPADDVTWFYRQPTNDVICVHLLCVDGIDVLWVDVLCVNGVDVLCVNGVDGVDVLCVDGVDVLWVDVLWVDGVDVLWAGLWKYVPLTLTLTITLTAGAVTIASRAALIEQRLGFTRALALARKGLG